jgi:hypothetical protein
MEIGTSPPPAILPAAPAPAPKAAPAPKVESAPAAPPTSTTTAEVNIDPGELGKWSKVSKAKRAAETELAAAKTRIAELEALKPSADRSSTWDKLKAEGKFLEALKSTGLTKDEQYTLFEQWSKAPADDSEPAPVPAEFTDLRARFDALEAAKKADDEARTKRDQEAKSQANERDRAEALNQIQKTIEGDASRWARCAKDPETARLDAAKVAAEKVRALGRPINEAEFDEISRAALDVMEGHYKALADKFYIPEAKRSATVRPIRDYIRDSSPVAERKTAVTLDGNRGSLRTPATETKGRLTEAEAKAKAMASIKAMTRST